MIDVERFLAAHPPRQEEDADVSGGEDGNGQARGRAGASPGRREQSRSRTGRTSRRPTPTDRPDDLDDCREAALRLLDAAPRPSGALRERLLSRGYDEGIVEEVIARLVRVGLIDDDAYARMAVRHCLQRQMGRRGAVAELVRKGVDRQLAEEIPSEPDARGLFEEAAWELGRAVAARTRGKDPQVARRRLWAAGGRKGHDPDTLRRVAQDLF